MATPAPIHVPIRHHVPLRVEGRDGVDLYALEPALTPVEIPGVDPRALEPRSLPRSGVHDGRVLFHDGRLWVPLEHGEPGGTPRTATLEQGLAVLSGEADPVNDGFSPFRPHLPARATTRGGSGRRPLDRRIATRARSDHAEIAAASVVTRAANALLHDGRHVYRLLPAPAIGHDAVGVGYRPETYAEGWIPLYAHWRREEAVRAFADGNGPNATEAYALGIDTLVESWGPGLRDVVRIDDDVRRFLRVGSFVVRDALRLVREDERHGAWDRVSAGIFELCARAAIDAFDGDPNRDLELMQRAARDVPLWSSRRSERLTLSYAACQSLSAFCREVALPAARAMPHLDEDAPALAGLVF